MTKLNQIYKCNVCGNIVEVVHTGAGELVCCGQPMELQLEKSQDEGQEKHLPIIEKTASGVKVKVGSVPHPMIAEHFLEWIEVLADGKVYRQFFKAGDQPEVEFDISTDASVQARVYCNLHGLWQSA